MIKIDGSQGEGGGQMLRTSLALSACTGKAFVIENIRAKRKKPGLMRQHLSCVHAVGQICNARVEGDEISSQRLSFVPGPVKAGDYAFAVGTAGSAMLVLQAVLPPLLLAGGSSGLILEGGTHNPMSPTFNYINEIFIPLLNRIGYACSAEIESWGFFPAGGGRVRATIGMANGPLIKLKLDDPGEFIGATVLAAAARIPWAIADDECTMIVNSARFAIACKKAVAVESPGPGNVAMVRLDYKNCSAMFTAFGELGVSRKKIAAEVAREANRFFASHVAVDPHLADQILIPMALAGGGSFTTVQPSLHTLTNMQVIESFLPVRFNSTQVSPEIWKIVISADS